MKPHSPTPDPLPSHVALVHLIPGRGPVGVWRADGDWLDSYYPDQAAEHRPRGEAALAAKGERVPWLAWFEQLADRVPYFDDYALIDTGPGTPLPQVYTDALHAWSQLN